MVKKLWELRNLYLLSHLPSLLVLDIELGKEECTYIFNLFPSFQVLKELNLRLDEDIKESAKKRIVDKCP